MSTEQKFDDPEHLKAIIIQLRRALDTVKDKYRESQGAWFLLDMIEPPYWVREVVAAEEASAPFMPPPESKKKRNRKGASNIGKVCREP